MMFRLFTFECILLMSALTIDIGVPLNILGIFQHPRFSHFQFFEAVTKGLASAGHNLTVISHFPLKAPVLRYRDLKLTGMDTQMNGIDIQNMQSTSFYDHLLEFSLLYKFAEEACNLTLNSQALAQVLDERVKYDVILLEQFNTDCLIGVSHILNAPVVALISSPMMPWLYERFGSPFLTSHMPALYMAYSADMNFFQRLNNWFNFHVLRLLYEFYSIPAADAMIRSKFGNNMPPVKELVKNTAVILVNTHFSLSGVKPLSPAIIEVGGIHIQAAKPLPQYLQNWLDNAENGAIVISWGSMIRAATLSIDKRNELLKAFGRLKQRVIWKWENETVPNKPKNVLISKWLPQLDVLCHPNVEVFMTHGGLMGVSEAVHCAVPMIVTPINGDQFINAAALEHRGIGVILPYNEMKEDTILKTIEMVLNKRYKEKAKIVSNSFNLRPMSALNTAIWWVEYVGNTAGAPLIKSSSIGMSGFVYYSWDIYGFLFLIFVPILCISYYSIRRTYDLIQKKFKIKLS